MALEIVKIGVVVNDNALRNIIKNDKLFFKDNKFSRTEYEKFLIKSGISAPQFEANIVEQEKRRQFLSSLAGGIIIPETLINQEFKKENQTKTIQYIDLEKYHAKNKPAKELKNCLLFSCSAILASNWGAVIPLLIRNFSYSVLENLLSL